MKKGMGILFIPQLIKASNFIFALCFLLCLHQHGFSFLSSNNGNTLDIKTLNVGEELQKEILPLHMGHRYYQIRGTKSSRWYEVKISYPASIPASFSIHLEQQGQFNMKRRLLNTEKLIFHSNEDELFVGVRVEPDGIMAKPNAKEREYIMFNIICEELTFGIPLGAWWVGALLLTCLILAFVIPHFLPSDLLPRNGKLKHKG